MTDKVHEITDAKKSRKPKWLTKKNAWKATALTVFGAAVVLVGVDKVTHRGSVDVEADVELETPES